MLTLRYMTVQRQYKQDQVPDLNQMRLDHPATILPVMTR